MSKCQTFVDCADLSVVHLLLSLSESTNFDTDTYMNIIKGTINANKEGEASLLKK